MNKRIKITVCAICALLMCLTVTTALAATSKATVDSGVTTWRQGAHRSLSASALNGTVKSTNATGPDRQTLIGKMWTQGNVFALERDHADVKPNGHSTLYWPNNGNETGTFFAEACAQYGNHEGYCSVWQ